MRKIIAASLSSIFVFGLLAAVAQAEPMKIEAVLTPKEQMRLDFADGS